VHVYEVRPRKDRRGVDVIPKALAFGRLWYGEIQAQSATQKLYSRSHDADQSPAAKNAGSRSAPPRGGANA
jgi:hypothetical protein